MNTRTEAATSAPGLDTSHSSGSWRGLRLSLRSSLGTSAFLHACGGPAAQQQQQFAYVEQCVHDYRDALLLAREWLEQLEEAGEHGGRTGESYSEPSQEGAVVQLLLAVAQWEAKQTERPRRRQLRHATKAHTDPSTGSCEDDEQLDASGCSVDVNDQTLSLLSAAQAAACKRRWRDEGQSSSTSSADTDYSESDEDGGSDDHAADVDGSLRGASMHASRETDAVAVLSPPRRRFQARAVDSLTSSHASTAAAVSELPVAELRYAGLLHDMCVLARHVAVPLTVVHHPRHQWLFLEEDVAYTLDDQLHHHRVVRAPAPAAPPTGDGALPAVSVQTLWTDLWELLGAAWRQRERLLGAYSRALPPALVPAAEAADAELASAAVGAMTLTSSSALPPFLTVPLPTGEATAPSSSSGSAAADPLLAVLAVPPRAGASHFHQQRYDRYVARFWRAQARMCLQAENAARRARAASAAAAGGPSTQPIASGSRLAHSVFGQHSYAAQDTIAFGPFTPTRIGLLQRPHEADAASPERSSVGYMMRSPLDGVWRALRSAAALPRQTASAAALPVLVSSPFFDAVVDDATVAAAVPYVPPEVFARLCQARQSLEGGGAARNGLPVAHSFSDDAWNAAVVVLEAALSAFDLQASCLATRTPSGADGASAALPRTASVFADTVRQLTAAHGMPLVAAHNFLYSALHHFSALARGEGPDAQVEANAAARASGTVEPRALAQSWRAHLTESHGAAFVTGVVGELCRTGLCWRREERWRAFVAAHAANAADVNSIRPSAAGTVPLTSPFGDPPLSPPSPFGTLRARQRGGSVGSLDAMPGSRSSARESTTATPLGSPHAALTELATEAALARRAPDVSDRQMALVRTPLLPLLIPHRWQVAGRGVPVLDGARAAGAGSTAARRALGYFSVTELWDWLGQWRRQVERVAIQASGAHGVVGPQRQMIVFTELIRLGREGISLAHRPPRHATGSGSAPNGSKRASVEDCCTGRQRFLVASHPFLRGVIQRGQLPALAAVVPAYGVPSREEGSDPGEGPRPLTRSHLSDEAPLIAAMLDKPSLFLPNAIVHVLLSRVSAQALQARRLQERQQWDPSSRGGTGSGVQGVASIEREGSAATGVSEDSRTFLPVHHVSSDALSPLPPQPSQQRGALRTLLGDLKRLQHRAAVATLGRAASWTDLLYPPLDSPAHPRGATLHADSAGRSPLQRAAWGLMREVDLSVALQLRVTAELRSRLLRSASASSAGQAVRAYLVQLHREMGVTLVPIPAAIRGEVWGALLGVPPARQRETLYASLRSSAFRSSSADRQITLDTPRCHQYHPLLSSEEGQAKLQRVIKAWLALPRSTALAYWQGTDSVCAVLLTVSYADEALVVAQLDALTRLLVAHSDATTETRTPQPLTPPTTAAERGVGVAFTAPPVALLSTVAVTPSAPCMSAALRQFTVCLRYCDPLLATHITALDCPPQLFAISWLLTLFAHGLPTRQVCLLWDWIFLYRAAYPHCLPCMCCAFLQQRRTSIMGQDASGVLAALGSGGATTDVVTVLADTAVLMRAIPSCVGAQPDEGEAGGDDGGGSSSSADHMATESGQGAADAARVRRQQQRQHWLRLSATHAHDRGNSDEQADGLQEPPAQSWRAVVRRSPVAYMDMATLLTALAPRATVAGTAPAQDPWWQSGLFLVDLRAQSPGHVGGADVRAPARVLGALPLPLAARHAAESFERRTAEVAAELVRQLRNPSMAAVLPAAGSLPARPPSATGASGGVDRRPETSPLVVKTSRSPHVLLLTSGRAYFPRTVSSGEAAPGVESNDDDEAVAVPLALALAQSGVHNVSLLLGGVEQIKRHAPWLIVEDVTPRTRPISAS